MSLTLKEVIEALLDGKKLTNENWSFGKYIFLAEKYISTQNGDVYSKPLNESVWILYKEPKEKIKNLTFGQALDLLMQDKATKISCWFSDDVYVYKTTANYPILYVHTIGKRIYQWTPLMAEMLEAKWRVVE